jgi:hypothetical protein
LGFRHAIGNRDFYTGHGFLVAAAASEDQGQANETDEEETV